MNLGMIGLHEQAFSRSLIGQLSPKAELLLVDNSNSISFKDEAQPQTSAWMVSGAVNSKHNKNTKTTKGIACWGN